MAKRERLRGRLIDKVMVEYNNLDGPPLNATGNALVASEVELLITRGALRQVSAHPHKISNVPPPLVTSPLAVSYESRELSSNVEELDKEDIDV